MINKTPVLLITYRRSNYLRETLNKLEEYNYHNVYLYSNFWNNNSEVKKEVENVRNLINNYSKTSEINFHFHFSNIHKPVDQSITSAIDWFFTQVDQGIILEDDIGITFPSLEFISYGLHNFKNENNIASISAYTEQSKYKNSKKVMSMYSFMFHSWGWGTWRKIWKRFDYLESSNYKLKRDHQLFRFNSALANTFQRILNKCKKRKIITWDYQFQNFCFINDLRNLMPTIPLIENLGVGDKFAENCKSFLPKSNEIIFNKNSFKKIDLKNPIDLNIKDEINLFKNKYPSFKERFIRKFLRFIQKF